MPEHWILEPPLQRFFSVGRGFRGRIAVRLGIKSAEVLGQGRPHLWTEMMRDIEHILVRTPALIKGQRLVFEVLDLLTRKSRNGESALKTFPLARGKCYKIVFWPEALAQKWRARPRPSREHAQKSRMPKFRQSKKILQLQISWHAASDNGEDIVILEYVSRVRRNDLQLRS